MLDKAHAITLPSPHQDTGVGLEQCIRERRSVRSFRDQALTGSMLGQLLWAAQGITGADDRRAVSSAGALYPLELYVAAGNVVCLRRGVYHYVPDRHELREIASGYQREKLVGAAGGQEWIAAAPATICIAADFERTSGKYGLPRSRLCLHRSRARCRKPDAAGGRDRLGDHNDWRIRR
jgi:nitroreductase